MNACDLVETFSLSAFERFDLRREMRRPFRARLFTHRLYLLVASPPSPPPTSSYCPNSLRISFGISGGPSAKRVDGI